jgi:hypothetical protein
MKRFFAMLVAMMLMGTAALAMPVGIDEGTMKLSCKDGDGNVTLDVAEFQLLGMDMDGQYLIYADGGYYSLLNALQGVNQADAGRVDEVAGIREDSLPQLARGSKGDAVRQFQEALVTLGYLDGGADGDFGGKTETAIMALQEALGLEQTGVADARLQMLALSMIQPKLVLENQGNNEELLAAIAQKTGLDPQTISDNNLILDYDDIAGTGFLSDGTVITYANQAMGDIDQYALTFQFGLRIQDQADGTASVDPVVKVSCLCVRRPVIQEIVLKSGNIRANASLPEIKTALNGVKTEESCIAPLTAEMVDALANVVEADELKIRVNGQYESFDIRVDKAQLASLARIGALAKTLAH